MDLNNYLLAETNLFTKENGYNFECTINSPFDLIPDSLDPDPWEESLETTIEKVTEIGNDVFKYDFVLEDKNIEEDDYDDDAEDAPEKFTKFSLQLKTGDKIGIKRFYQADDEDFYYVALLIEITAVEIDRFLYKIIGISENDADEEDYSYAPSEYKIDEKIPYLPKDAVFSIDVTLTELKKSGENFIMSLFVKSDDEDENQTMTFTVRKGTRLEFDELEMGVACFVRPDRNPIDLEVLEVSEESITLKKC